MFIQKPEYICLVALFITTKNWNYPSSGELKKNSGNIHNTQQYSAMKRSKLSLGKLLNPHSVPLFIKWDITFVPPNFIMMTKDNMCKIYRVKTWLITMTNTVFLILKAIERTCQQPLEHELFNQDHIPFKSFLGSLWSDI